MPRVLTNFIASSSPPQKFLLLLFLSRETFSCQLIWDIWCHKLFIKESLLVKLNSNFVLHTPAHFRAETSFKIKFFWGRSSLAVSVLLSDLIFRTYNTDDTFFLSLSKVKLYSPSCEASVKRHCIIMHNNANLFKTAGRRKQLVRKSFEKLCQLLHVQSKYL